ncbi:MAG TPA: sugar kinase [Rhodobacteraceae bacterium]|nr:sugar kinase [Paracoccaceae bacterium]
MAEILVLGMAVADFVFAMDQLPDRAAKYRANTVETVGGGCAANAAVAIARLGGVAHLATRLGDDPMGDLILSDLVAEGVRTQMAQRAPGGRSSFSSVCVDAAGERQIVNFRGDGLTQDTGWIKDAPPVDAVLADNRWTAGAARALDLARARGVPGVVDAEAPTEPEVLARASHVAFSRDGLLSFTGGDALVPALREAAARLPGWVCVTDGANGTTCIDGGTAQHVPACAVEVRDTLGAGDIWHGAFVLALAEGQGEVPAIRFANAAAALKCTTFGGRKGCPDRTDLDEFLKETS